VEDSGVSPVPGVERWSYGAFRQDHESESVTVPVVRDDGESAESPFRSSSRIQRTSALSR